MPSTQYLKVTGLYIIGIIIIVYGLYSFFTVKAAEAIASSFYIMLAGLAFSGIGSAYGRKKMRSPGFKKSLEEKKKKEELRKKEEVNRRVEKIKSKDAGYETPSRKAPAERVSEEGAEKIVICLHCGEENKYKAKFCDKCGRKLRPK